MVGRGASKTQITSSVLLPYRITSPAPRVSLDSHVRPPVGPLSPEPSEEPPLLPVYLSVYPHLPFLPFPLHKTFLSCRLHSQRSPLSTHHDHLSGLRNHSDFVSFKVCPHISIYSPTSSGVRRNLRPKITFHYHSVTAYNSAFTTVSYTLSNVVNTHLSLVRPPTLHRSVPVFLPLLPCRSVYQLMTPPFGCSTLHLTYSTVLSLLLLLLWAQRSVDYFPSVTDVDSLTLVPPSSVKFFFSRWRPVRALCRPIYSDRPTTDGCRREVLCPDPTSTSLSTLEHPSSLLVLNPLHGSDSHTPPPFPQTVRLLS